MGGTTISIFSCQGIMKISLFLMTGIAFTFGVLLGLLVRLPIVAGPGRAASLANERGIRSLLQHQGGLTDNYVGDSMVKGPSFDYEPNKRWTELDLGRDETVLDLAPNSPIIPASYKEIGEIGDNSDHGSNDQSKYRGNTAFIETKDSVNRLKEHAAETPQLSDLPIPNKQQGTVESGSATHVELSPPGADENGHEIEDSPKDKRVFILPEEKLTTKFQKLTDIIQGVHWSGNLEKLCSSVGNSEDFISSWKKQAGSLKVVHLEEGCGRMQNRLLTFEDSTQACARYRPNTDQIQGEIYSYYLSKILGMNNVPPSVLSVVKSVDPRWARVNQDIAISQWADDKVIVLTKWMADLEPAYIPEEMRESTRRLHPEDSQLLNKSLSGLCELVQWSDLIIFDYLTNNLDRIVNNMFNQQWNSQMMNLPAHNLEKHKNSGKLVFLDNESGLFHGYRLLEKYSKYHEALLHSLCIFRKSTSQAVEQLFLDNNIGDKLQQTLVHHERHHDLLPEFPEVNRKILNERLGHVYDRIQRCQLRNSR